MNKHAIYKTSIPTILCWLVICGVLYSKASSNPIYYDYLKGKVYFRLFDFCLLFIIPFYFGAKVQSWGTMDLGKITRYLTFLKVTFLIISLFLLPHFLYWFYVVFFNAWYARTYNIGVILCDIIVGTYLLYSFNSLNRLIRETGKKEHIG